MSQSILESTPAEGPIWNSEQLMRLVLGTLPVGVAVMNRAGDIVLVNDASKRIWGGVIPNGRERWAQTKAWWHDSGEKLKPESWASIRALSQGESSWNELIDIETYDGQRKTIHNSVAPIRTGDGLIVGVVAVNEDVTERVQAEKGLRDANQRLRILSRRRARIQEEERSRLARELHDQIGQLLTAAKINVQSAKATKGKSALNEKLLGTARILDSVLQEVRKISFALRPPVLDDLGLAPALRWMLSEAAGSAGLAAEFSADSNLERPDAESETACYRVAVEAVTNTIRHADAQKIRIELNNVDGTIRLKIIDDGGGFDLVKIEHMPERDRLGLSGMGERAFAVGGRFEIRSEPGKGTEVIAHFPLSAVPDLVS